LRTAMVLRGTVLTARAVGGAILATLVLSGAVVRRLGRGRSRGRSRPGWAGWPAGTSRTIGVAAPSPRLGGRVPFMARLRRSARAGRRRAVALERQRATDQPLDIAQLALFLAADQRDRDAGRAVARRA